MTNPAHTFFWHDYETFGGVPRRDRPSQFAGVRTDARPQRDRAAGDALLPAGARLPARARGLPADRHRAAALPAARHRRARLRRRDRARAGAAGHRRRRLQLDPLRRRGDALPVLAQPDRSVRAARWQNGCGRWDLLDVVRTAYALRPDGIEWPRHDDGRPSFKLEHLAAANGLAHEAAHDALSDVRATIALARLVKPAPAAAVGLLPAAAPQGRGGEAR